MLLFLVFVIVIGQEFDVIIVGAGLSGLTQLRLLRENGFNAIVLEQGDDIGGTWFFNKYPGARVDVRNHDYYMHHPDLNKAWNFSEEFSSQPELLQYIHRMNDIFNLKQHIHLKSPVTSMCWNTYSKSWQVFSNNKIYNTKFVILATGPLSKPNKPTFQGLNDFEGPIYYSSQWPSSFIDFAYKRVGIMGTGSTGVQMIPIIAKSNVKNLTVFQRTPNYVFPLRNKPINGTTFDKEERRRQAFASPSGIPLHNSQGIPYAQLGRKKFMEQLKYYYQNVGGFDFMFSIVTDLVINPDADLVIQDFIRGKISEVVKNPLTAKKLSPNYGYICKRPLLGTNYYETYNQPNVNLIDMPIDRFVKDGVIVNGVHHELDMFIFATGFDALVGAINDIHIVGENGRVLKNKFDKYVKSYLGLATAGFPNLFHLVAFQSPSIFANMAVAIEHHTGWVTDLLVWMRKNNYQSVEARVAAEDDWVAYVDRLARYTLWTREECKSWYLGSNIAGKKRQFLGFCGMFSEYEQLCRDVADKNYKGFRFDRKMKDEL
uniref:Monooxygenase n=1 Tax=viral metagenome TaxID=1070528 RepID=A0A6C0C7B8_9ZZZZ